MTARAKIVDRPLFWVLAIFLAALAIAYLTRPQGTMATNTLRSSYRTTPDGTAALARTLASFGLDVAPRLTPMVDAEPVAGTVILLTPVRPPTPREVRALLDHVRGGGTLLYSPTYAVSAELPSSVESSPLDDSLGIELRYRDAEETFRRTRLEDPSWKAHRLTDGLPPPRDPLHALRLPGAVDLLSAVADGGAWTVAAELPLGEGRVVVFSESEAFSNAMLADDPQAALFVRAVIAYTASADTVFFDEYHLGIDTRRSSAEVVWHFLTETPLGRALFHLAAAMTLVLVAAGIRFGSPTPAIAPPDRERRSPLEHVSALGDLYREAGAARTAALLLIGRLARSTRNRPPATIEEADRLLRHLGSATEPGLARTQSGLLGRVPDLTAIAGGIDAYLLSRTHHDTP